MLFIVIFFGAATRDLTLGSGAGCGRTEATRCMRRLAVSRVAMIVVPNVEPRSAWVLSGAPKETD